MKRFVLGAFVVLILAACAAPLMPIGSVQLAPAPKIRADAFLNLKETPTALFLVLSPSDQGKKKTECEKKKQEWDEITGNGSTTVNLTDPVFDELKNLFNHLVLMCGYPFDIVTDEATGATVTTVYEKGEKPKPPVEEFQALADFAKKGDSVKWQQCKAVAEFINAGEFTRDSFVVKLGDSDDLIAKKKSIFNALELLGGTVCAKWFTVRVIGGVYFIFEK